MCFRCWQIGTLGQSSMSPLTATPRKFMAHLSTVTCKTIGNKHWIYSLPYYWGEKSYWNVGTTVLAVLAGRDLGLWCVCPTVSQSLRHPGAPCMDCPLHGPPPCLEYSSNQGPKHMSSSCSKTGYFLRSPIGANLSIRNTWRWLQASQTLPEAHVTPSLDMEPLSAHSTVTLSGTHPLRGNGSGNRPNGGLRAKY